MALAIVVDGGVGSEALVWSPCSSLISYSPPPNLSDLEDEIPTVVHPPSPPQSSPSSPTEGGLVTPCDVTKIMPPESDTRTLDQRLNAERPKEKNDNLNSVLTRRKSNFKSPRKKVLQSPVKKVLQNNVTSGQVTSEPALLARLSGLSDPLETQPVPRAASRKIDPLESQSVHRSSPRKISPHKFYSRNGSNGLSRHGLRLKKSKFKDLEESKIINDFKESINSNLKTQKSSKDTKNLIAFESPKIVTDCKNVKTLKDINKDFKDKSELLCDLKRSLTNNNLNDENNRHLPPLPQLLPPNPSYNNSSYSGSESVQSSGDGSIPSSSGTSTPTSFPRVRFPPPQKKESGDVCNWKDCGMILGQHASLLEHIQAIHVEGQLDNESFSCFWVGCKVFEKPSCSVSWLERHVLTHGGEKPFKCIVEGCWQRFRSQTALGRHVNHHFNASATPPAPKNTNQASPNKLLRKNGRKVRLRKRPFSARIFDVFDLCTMEKLRWSLMRSTDSRMDVGFPLNDLILHAQVVGKRKSCTGESEMLIRWFPADL